MDVQLEPFAENPDCRKCMAQAPLNRPWYTFHEKWYNNACPTQVAEHIHLCCRRCNYRWLMAPKEATGTKWYDKPPLGRESLKPGMSSYQENTERFDEKDNRP